MKGRPSSPTLSRRFTASCFLIGGVIPAIALWNLTATILPQAFSSEDGAAASSEGGKSGTRFLSTSERGETSSSALVNESPAGADSGVERLVSEERPASKSEKRGTATDARKGLQVERRSSRKRLSDSSFATSDPESMRKELMDRARDLAAGSEAPVEALISVGLTLQAYGYTAESRAAFEKALDLAADPQSEENTGKRSFRVVQAMVSAGFLERASEVSGGIRFPYSAAIARGEVAVAIAKRNDVWSAKKALSPIQHDGVREMTLARIAEAEASFSSAADIEQTLSLMKNSGVQGSGFSRSGLRLADRGDFNGAIRLIEQIDQGEQKDRAFSAVAEKRARKGDTPGGLALLGRVQNSSNHDRSLRNIADTLVRRNDVSGAKDTALGIFNETVRASTLSAIAHQVARRGDVRSALNMADFIDEPVAHRRALSDISIATVFSEGVSPARNLANRIDDVTQRARALRGIAEATDQTGDLPEALKTARSINVDFERSLAYSNIARRQASRGRDRPAIKLLQEAATTSAHLTHAWERDEANASFALAYAETSRPEQALPLAAQVAQEKKRDDLLAKLASSFARKQRFDLAESSADGIGIPVKRRRARSKMVELYATSLEPAEAITLADTIRSRTEKVQFLLAVARGI